MTEHLSAHGPAPVPVLETERVCLVAPDMADFEAATALLMGPRAVFMHPKTSRQDVWLSFASDVGGWILQGFGPWSVRRRVDGAIVGSIAISKPPAFPEVELGWHLYDGYEGEGYATEAAEAAREWAFGARKLVTLVSYIDPDNVASIRVAERLGAAVDTDANRPEPDDLVFRHARAAA
ncbi:MAG: GNAT family protein [Pseudomonadota bacterium]